MKQLEFSFRDAIYIGIGGLLGSILRWWFGLDFAGQFPFPTLLVNVIGAVALGILYGSQHQSHPRGNYLYMVGFCGSFTTVSLFSYETVQLLQAGQPGMAAVNIIVPILLSIGLLAMIIPPVERAVRRKQL